MRSILLSKFRLYTNMFLTDPILFAKEVIRRILGKSYHHSGFFVSDGNNFRVLYRLKKYKKEWKIIKDKENCFLFNKKYNIKFWISNNNIGIYDIVLAEENLDLKPYRIKKEDVLNKRVLDVGAYVGDTVIGFILKGAKYVVGVEPAYYDLARKNLEINNIKNAEIRDYGLADREMIYGVNNNYGGTGLSEGNFEIKTKSWEEILRNEKFDLAKVDCEGCELYLLSVPDELLRKIPVWIIEIHGTYLPLLNKFKRAGFKANIIKKYGDFLSIWRFES